MTNLVIYCGKGIKKEYIVKSGKYKGYKKIYDRAYSNCDRPYRIDDTIEVFKVKYFNNEKEAFAYEELLTSWYKACGQCWYNDSISTKPSEEARRKSGLMRRGERHPFFGKTGEDTPMFGKHHTEETKRKIGISNTKGTIYCPELNLTFENANDAVHKCGEMGIKLDKGAISRVVNGERKYHGYIIRDEKKVRLTWKRIKNS